MANQQSKIWMVIIMSRRLNEITGDSKYITNDYHAALTLIAEFISANGIPCTADNIWSQVENWLPINYRFGLIQSSDLDDLYRAHLKYV